jgi:hypothetical protein
MDGLKFLGYFGALIVVLIIILLIVRAYKRHRLIQWRDDSIMYFNADDPPNKCQRVDKKTKIDYMKRYMPMNHRLEVVKQLPDYEFTEATKVGPLPPTLEDEIEGHTVLAYKPFRYEPTTSHMEYEGAEGA